MAIQGNPVERLTVLSVEVEPPRNQNIPDDRLLNGVVAVKVNFQEATFTYHHRFKNKPDTLSAIEEAYQQIGRIAAQIAKQADDRTVAYQGVR